MFCVMDMVIAVKWGGKSHPGGDFPTPWKDVHKKGVDFFCMWFSLFLEIPTLSTLIYGGYKVISDFKNWFLIYKIEEIFEKRGVKIEKNHIFYFFIKEKFWFFLLRYLQRLSNPLRVSELFLFWKSGNKQKSLLLNGEKAVWKTGAM